MIRYKIVKAVYCYSPAQRSEESFIEEFEQKVEQYIKEDWFPIGGIAMVSTDDWIELAQAFLKG